MHLFCYSSKHVNYSTKEFISKEETFSPIMVIKQEQAIGKDGSQLPHQQHSVAVASVHVDSFFWVAAVWPVKTPR